ncbi:ABC transporter ATP-binding protein [Echinimonas agarilytica]|uniref:ATP-binding cassette domain-containing protein n=1 Tax=Echinimonas agarilytica TaxID=1215918 RepID=A0AA41W6B8_9GAMM|nr:ATP-binding cassette domain-containing protein [Echinimonas agarilytica]MCM2679640.1 ATP-binding cassette domain-containing protein [Echinimonas agarilytica]
MIQVKQLNRTFGAKKAVNNLSFSLSKGQVLGLIGPNGAGKSTAMRMITGFLRPSSGSISLGGIDVWQHPKKAKRLLGYLPESAPLFEDMSVEGFLGYLSGVRGLHGRERTQAIDRAVDLCFLQSVRHQAIDTLSKGYRHRVCLAQSILHDPPIIIFDEPTDGLDPNQKQEIRDLINEFRHNKTIILSTHILDEVNAVCTDVLLLDRGKKLFTGTLAELRSQTPEAGDLLLQVGFDYVEQFRTFREKLKILAGVSAVEMSEMNSNELRVKVIDKTLSGIEDLTHRVVQLVVEEKMKLLQLRQDQGSLELAFRTMTSYGTHCRGDEL